MLPRRTQPAGFAVRFRRGIALLLSVNLLAIFLIQATHGQVPKNRLRDTLPGEAQLPGTQRADQVLPDESVLPGTQRPTPTELPDEATLSSEQRQSIDENAEEEELAPVGGQSPILRLAFDGHTGRIRTLDLSDGGRTLVTGGEDKDLHVWRRTNINRSGWLHRRTIRWPVTRGPRGLIYSTRLKGDLAAFAGYGAFGYQGEVRIVDVASGDLQRTLFDAQSGHLSNVTTVAWSPDDELRLATLDMEGRLIVWQANEETGLWSGRTYVDVDAEEYSADTAERLRLYDRRAFVPMTFLSPNRVAVARFVGIKPDAKGIANWHIELIDLDDRESRLLTQVQHLRHIRSLSSSSDGRVLASCDFGGSIGVWKLDADGNPTSAKTFQPTRPPLFVRLDSTGNQLLVGTEAIAVTENEKPSASIEIWDVTGESPTQGSRRTMTKNVRAGIIDTDHREVIVAQDNEIQVLPLDRQGKLTDEPPQVLTADAKPVQKVAFHRDDGSHKIAFGWNRNSAGAKILEGVFDLGESKLLGRGEIEASEYFGTQQTAKRWDVGLVNTPFGPSYQLFEAGQPRGTLPHSLEICTARCTLPAPKTGSEETDELPETGAVIVGTGGANGIYAYRANQSDPPELLRQFRDHSGAITSVSTSSDGHYLVSAAEDSTISIWNLQELFTASKSVNRWGTEFEIEDVQLFATQVREAGPLYFRGVRSGDRLLSMEWTDSEANAFAESNPGNMRDRLNDVPYNTLVHLKFTRRGRPGPDFQSFPAWRPIATLFIDQSRSWAYWTPAGFYDASFNGHQLFGWQINHHIDQPVDYFRAAQFRKRLERPDVMRQLLTAGSLPAAMRQTLTQIGPPPGEGTIVNQIRSRPTIELLAPDPSLLVVGNLLRVRARISAPLGASLIQPKAFVSGVPAVEQQVIARDAHENTTTFEWQFRLPRDQEIQLEVLAATESEAVDRLLVDLQHQPEGARSKPRLHVLAIGASRYRDPQIQSLDFAADATEKMLSLFREASGDLYRTSGDRLVNNDATRPMWRVFAKHAADELRQTVSPDDLVIMYLCGHGLRDRRTNRWYFVTADANYSDLMNDRYDDCIAFSDLAALSQLPCRKLAILDSCHSGAVQPLMRRDDLKSALRFLQDDVVLTLTASEGDEEAAEQKSARMGRFSAALVDALRGKAPELDTEPNEVSLLEVIDYVTRRVTDESASDDVPQHPTASPHYLLRTLRIPLTSRP
ncbi:MAG: caspase family protein [Rubripirellula sp.]